MNDNVDCSEKENKVNLKKTLILILAVLIPVFVSIQYYMSTRSPEPVPYIFDKTSEIGLDDVKENRSHVNFGEASVGKGVAPDFDIRAYFREEVIGGHTLKYFKHLEMHFGELASLEEHFDAVYKYLKLQLSDAEAAKLFETYKKYLNCEMELARRMKDWGTPLSPDRMLELLARAQEYRRTELGPELANSLFGADVKAKEYSIRRGMIVQEDLYGEEKEKRIRELSDDMWGDESEAVLGVQKPYSRYREKLSLYKKDMAELETDDDKAQLVRKFREEVFSPEVVARLEAVDRQHQKDRENELLYRTESSEIMMNTELTDSDKNKKIEELQARYFKDPEAFRRRENMQRGLEALKEKS